MAESEDDIRAFVASRTWQVVESIGAFDGWTWGLPSKIKVGNELRYDGLKLLEFGDLPPNIVRKQQQWILERKG